MKRGLAISVCLLIAACRGSGGIVERVDAQAALRVATDPALAVFARTDTQFSRAARDYLYLGPVEVDTSGARGYFLWVGLASTIDRDFLVADVRSPNLLVLDVAGAPIEFELRALDDLVPMLSGRELYDPAVGPRSVLAARVTRDQLALIAKSAVDSVRIGSDGSATQTYFLWKESTAWPVFAAHAGLR